MLFRMKKQMQVYSSQLFDGGGLTWKEKCLSALVLWVLYWDVLMGTDTSRGGMNHRGWYCSTDSLAH